MLLNRVRRSVMCLAITCFVAAAPGQADDLVWKQVTDAPAWNPQDGSGALVFKNRMWLLGGWNPSIYPLKCNNEVWSSTDGAAWTLVKPNTFVNSGYNPESDWKGRHTAGYVVYKGKMWIIGGDPLQGHYQNDVWNSADGKRWSHVNKQRPVPWGPRVLHYTLVFQDKIWIMGGQTVPQFAPGKEVFCRDIWTTTDGITWTQVTPEEPYWPARGMIGGNVVFKDRMWILGGGTYNTPETPSRKFYNDVWSSANGINWQQHVQSAPWAPRQYHDVAVFDGKMWVLGGGAPRNSNDVWYSSDGVNWHEFPDTPWNSRHASSVFVYDNALWIAAGNNIVNGAWEKDVWKLTRVSVASASTE